MKRKKDGVLIIKDLLSSHGVILKTEYTQGIIGLIRALEIANSNCSDNSTA
jgi:hypothetical protein